MSRLINILFALDCFLFSLLTFGGAYTFESFSSAAWRSQLNGQFYGWLMRPIIDKIMFFDVDHCQRAYNHAYLNLPPDQRSTYQTT